MAYEDFLALISTTWFISGVVITKFSFKKEAENEEDLNFSISLT